VFEYPQSSQAWAQFFLIPILFECTCGSFLMPPEWSS
jgi:hypothetical protein